MTKEEEVAKVLMEKGAVVYDPAPLFPKDPYHAECPRCHAANRIPLENKGTLSIECWYCHDENRKFQTDLDVRFSLDWSETDDS